MLKILSILFVIVFIIPFLLRGVMRFLFGSRPQPNKSSQQKRNTSSRTQQPPPKKKVINKDEGEYIDYEEVKG
jgi:hypothetical protein